MIAGESNVGALPPEVRARGWKPRKKGGWKGLVRGQYVAYRPHTTKRLAVALVLYNDRGNQSVEVQTCRSIWAGMAVFHKLEYRTTVAEGAEVVMEPTGELVKAIIFYSAHVK